MARWKRYLSENLVYACIMHTHTASLRVGKWPANYIAGGKKVALTTLCGVGDLNGRQNSELPGQTGDFQCTLCYSTFGRALVGMAWRNFPCAKDHSFEEGGEAGVPGICPDAGGTY
jgi:hypothetical protein